MMAIDAIWPAWLWLLVNGLATYRLTHLITDDLITEPLRARVIRLGEPWATGIECPWCVSFWVATGVVVLSVSAVDLWAPIATIFTFSAVAGLLANLE
jgi:hypothetical protein